MFSRVGVFIEILEALEEVIGLFDEYEELFLKQPTDKNKRLLLAIRDSMIKRFGYCTDLLWKVLKIYLENVEKIELEIFSPRGVVRDAVKARLLTEDEGDECIKMVEASNKTSHIYHAQTAENIALRIPDYYALMRRIVERIVKKVESK